MKKELLLQQARHHIMMALIKFNMMIRIIFSHLFKKPGRKVSLDEDFKRSLQELINNKIHKG